MCILPLSHESEFLDLNFINMAGQIAVGTGAGVPCVL